MGTIEGRVALVTGGASGIGRATARRFAAEGATVVIADIDDAKGTSVAEECGGRFVHLDVTDPLQWADLVAGLGPEGVGLAHLNAGVATFESDVLALTDQQYRRTMGVNVDGVVFGLRAVAPVIAAQGGGSIVVTASLGGLVPMPFDPVYSLSKHAVVAFARSVAPQLSGLGITVNAVCPGFTDTPLVDVAERDAIDVMAVPLLDPDVVAGAVIDIVLGGGTGEAWYCQPGRAPAPYAFRGVPGPRSPT
jgi:NAD(P)-dependent dehydrogenase (short-subunit alcohol dehydrogenase family)